MAVVSTTTVYRGLKAFSNERDQPRSLILGLVALPARFEYSFANGPRAPSFTVVNVNGLGLHSCLTPHPQDP